MSDINAPDHTAEPDYVGEVRAAFARGAEITEADQLKMNAQRSLYTLTEARRIRADARLMAAIRAYVREQRDEMTNLLDEIG